MDFQRGQTVRHLGCPEWGEGRVFGQDGDIVTVIFPNIGEKKLDQRYARLELLSTTDSLPVFAEWLPERASLSLERLEALCSRFYNELKENRSNSDDGKMALNVLRDIKETGGLSRTVKRQLFAWCHTNGSVFQRGVDLAQQICREIYGRVPTKAEIVAAGL